MSAALGAGHGVDFVDDHRLDAAERVAGLAGEQEEQRLRRGDEDVGRARGQPATLVGRGVTGADARPSRRARAGPAGRPRGGCRPAATRRLRSTSTASAFSGETYSTRQRISVSSGGGVLASLVERPQERRQRLARAGRGHDERVTTSPAIAVHAPCCAAVGAEKAAANQARVAGDSRRALASELIERWRQSIERRRGGRVHPMSRLESAARG